MADELQTFISIWDTEAKKTAAMLRALPEGQYDFQPDAGGRSLGELAWHLAEIEAYSGFGIERGAFEIGVRPPGVERPRTIEALGPDYERIHADSMERIRKLTSADLDRQVMFFTGSPMSIREILWSAVLHHQIHHRGQLSVLCRLAGGAAPGTYGPNREESAKLREKMAVTK